MLTPFNKPVMLKQNNPLNINTATVAAITVINLSKRTKLKLNVVVELIV